jgi:hypothetical protein
MKFLKLLIFLCLPLSLWTGCEAGESGGGLPQTQEPTSTSGPTLDANSGFDAGSDTSAAIPDTRQEPDTTQSPICTFNIEPPVSDTCPGNQVCILDNGLGQPGHCEGAFGRQYTVNVGEARTPERREDGECWDVGCGAPDLLIEVFLDGVSVLKTSTAEDSFYAEGFREKASVVLTASSMLDFVLYDEDLSSDDVIVNCRLDPVEASHLRSRLLLCGSTNGPGFLVGLVMQ